MGKLLELSEKKAKFEIINKSSSTAEILLYGGVGEDVWDESSVSAKQFSDALKDLPKGVSQIDLRINSPGGSVFDGVSIYERLKSHRAKVTAYVDGISASIATIIMMAADEIVISEGGMVMIHKPMAGVYGNTTEMEQMVNLLDKIESQMTSIYSKRTGMSRIEIAKMLDSGDTWFTAEEAVEAGLVDSINGESNLKIAASMVDKASWIVAKPVINTINAKKVKSVLSKRLEEMRNYKK